MCQHCATPKLQLLHTVHMVFPCPTISIENARIGNVESSHMYSGAGDEANDVTTYSLTWSYGTVQL